MKHIIMACLTAIFTLTTYFAQAQQIIAVPDGHGGSKVVHVPKGDSKVKITFQSKQVDYGKMPYNADGTRYFYYTNTGSKPLVIQTVTSSCGCTVPQWDKKPIAPGKSGKITVKYDTKKTGYFSRNVEVISNAATPRVTLTLKGSIENRPNSSNTSSKH